MVDVVARGHYGLEGGRFWSVGEEVMGCCGVCNTYSGWYPLSGQDGT